MTSSNGNISALLALCEGNQRSPGDSPHKGEQEVEQTIEMPVI